MKIFKLIIIRILFGIFVLSFSGCVLSSKPIYKNSDIIYEPEIIGEWFIENSKERLIIKKSIGNTYELEYVPSEDKIDEFDMHLVKIKGHYFLDLLPKEPDIKGKSVFYLSHFQMLHSFVFVRQINPTLQLSFPNSIWLRKYLDKYPSAIQHEIIDSQVALTADIDEIQNFLIEHISSNDLFNEFHEFIKSDAN